MERLTKDDLNKVCYDPWEICGMDKHCTKGCHEEGGCTGGCHILKIHLKLAEYEDAEENGLLIHLPCRVGDTVYVIDKDENGKLKVYEGEWTVVSLSQRNKDGEFELCGHVRYEVYDFFYNDGRTMPHGMYVGQEHTKFGKVVFLTREAAEQALAKMKGGGKDVNTSNSKKE